MPTTTGSEFMIVFESKTDKTSIETRINSTNLFTNVKWNNEILTFTEKIKDFYSVDNIIKAIDRVLKPVYHYQVFINLVPGEIFGGETIY